MIFSGVGAEIAAFLDDVLVVFGIGVLLQRLETVPGQEVGTVGVLFPAMSFIGIDSVVIPYIPLAFGQEVLAFGFLFVCLGGAKGQGVIPDGDSHTGQRNA